MTGAGPLRKSSGSATAAFCCKELSGSSGFVRLLHSFKDFKAEISLADEKENGCVVRLF